MSTVVDTNVLVVANGANENAGPTCQLRAVEELRSIQEARSLRLDGGREMFAEYSKHCSYAGQPGVGDEFFRWAVDNAAVLETVELTANEERRFEEFPDDPALVAFDWDDRLFVATALAGAPPAHIENAVDSDYSHHSLALQANGVIVNELCPGLLKA